MACSFIFKCWASFWNYYNTMWIRKNYLGEFWVGNKGKKVERICQFPRFNVIFALFLRSTAPFDSWIFVFNGNFLTWCTLFRHLYVKLIDSWTLGGEKSTLRNIIYIVISLHFRKLCGKYECFPNCWSSRWECYGMMIKYPFRGKIFYLP